jgi:maltose alpha-D-glucosyltransferase/alpha-amylase
VVANLSRFVQGVELDLARFKGVVPVEVFGQTRLPPIEDRPYFLTLAPHTFFWLALTPMADRLAGAPAGHRPAIVVHGRWEDDLLGGGAERLERALPGFLKRQRWFGAKGRDILGAEVVDAIPLGDRRIDAEAHREEPPTNAPDSGYLTLIQVGFAEGEGELYCLPLMVTEDVAAAEREDRVVAWVRREGAAGSGRAALVDAAAVEAFGRVLVDLVPGRRQLKGREGKIRGLPARALRNVSSATLAGLPLSAVRAEQSNTSLVLGDRYILKLFRRVEDGVNPELELGRFLTESTSFTALARFAGALEYRRAKGEPLTLAILHEYVPNEGDAWQYTLDAIHQYFEQVLAAPDTAAAPPVPGGLVEHLSGEPPPEIATRAGPYLESARVLGRRTAEMHRALGSTSRIPAFAPEPFTPMYQQSLFQSLRSKAEQALDTLRKRRSSLPPELAAAADQVLGSRDMLLALLHRVLERKVSGMRVRCHGDYHLGQILYTGRDFVVVDFEGEPARALGERRIKRSPLTDVAGLLRSSHYAVAAGALDGRVRPEDIPRLEPWARAWRFWVSQQFLQSYLGADAGSGLLPKNLGELAMLLDVYQLEKALYELRYELNHRPTWVGIPLEAVRQVLAGAGGGG